MILIFLLINDISVVPKYYTNTNYIYDMAVHGSMVYAATNGGVIRYDISSGAFDVLNNTDGLHLNRQTRVALDSASYIWTGSELGLDVVDPQFASVWHYPDEYLAGSIIQEIVCQQDSVYVGSSSGLLFIDTKNTIEDFEDDVRLRIFEAHGLPSDNILACAVDDTLIWVGTDNGLATFEKDFTNPAVYTISNGLLSNVIMRIVVADTIVYIATDNGMNTFHNGQFDTLLISSGIHDFCVCGESLVIAFDTLAQVGIFFEGDTILIKSGLPYRCVVNSVVSREGTLMCGLGNRYSGDNYGHGIGVFDPLSSVWETTCNKTLASNHISSISANDNGVFIACGSRNRLSAGISWWHDIGQWTTFNRDSVLPTNNIHRCVTAPDGKVWFAVNAFPDIDSSVMVLGFEPQDSTWQYIYNRYLDLQGTVAVWDIDFDYQNNMYLSLAGPDDRLWVLDSSLSTTYYLGEEHNGFVDEMAIDSSGRIWRTYLTDHTLIMVDTRSTLFDRSDDPGDAQYGVSDGLVSQIGLGCIVDQNNMFYFANDTGLVRYDGMDFKTIQGLTGKELLDLELDSQGRIWVMAREGVYYFDPGLDIVGGWQYSELGVHIEFLQPSNELIQIQGFEYDPVRSCFWLGGETGLLKLEIQGDTAVQLDDILVYPNPAIQHDIVKIKNIPWDSRVSIYSISGRLMASDLVPDPTFGEVVWHIPNNAGSGLYFALVESSQGSRVCKFAIVK
jgi:hypothetical protein